MCQVVWLPDGEAVETQGELVRQVLGGKVSALRFNDGAHGHSASYQPGVCLCPVRVEETLDAAGIRWEPDSWVGDVVAYPPTARWTKPALIGGAIVLAFALLTWTLVS